MNATVHVLRQIDVGDSIALEQAARILSKREISRGTTVLRSPDGSASAGVVLRQEPLDWKVGKVSVGPFTAEARLRLFDFGVVALRFTFTVPDATAATLMELSPRLVKESAMFDAKVRELWAEIGAQVQGAVTPWDDRAATELMD